MVFGSKTVKTSYNIRMGINAKY